MNKCARCKRILVSYETVHIVDGKMYCSKSCAINDLTNDYILNAREMAIEKYNDEAEVVDTADVLKEDLQEVRISVTCSTVIKLPINLSEAEAIEEATKLYHEGIIVVDLDDNDSVDVKCELVKDNSAQITGRTINDLKED